MWATMTLFEVRVRRFVFMLAPVVTTIAGFGNFVTKP